MTPLDQNVDKWNIMSAKEYDDTMNGVMTGATRFGNHFIRTNDDGVVEVEMNVDKDKNEREVDIICILNDDLKVLRIHARVRMLYLSSCKNLEAVEIRDPSSVMELVINNCPNIRIIPLVMPNMTNLTISACDLINELPYSDHLKYIDYARKTDGHVLVPAYPGDHDLTLNLDDFDDANHETDKINHANFDDFMTVANRIETLYMRRSTTKIVANKLPYLRRAKIESCRELQEFKAFSKNLETLEFKDCPNLTELSYKINSNMKLFKIRRCPNLMDDSIPSNLQDVGEFYLDNVLLPKELLEDRYERLMFVVDTIKNLKFTRVVDNVIRRVAESNRENATLVDIRDAEMRRRHLNPNSPDYRTVPASRVASSSKRVKHSMLEDDM